MKVLFTLLMSITTLISSAQLEGGGFGHFQTGATTGNFNALENYLSDFSGIDHASISRSGAMVGGAGYGIVRNVLIGGQGVAASYIVSGHDLANVQLSYGVGMFSMGYVVYSRNKVFMYPYMSLGAGGYSLVIENKDNLPLPISQSQEVKAAETRTFSLGQASYDIGFALKGLPFSKKESASGGFMLGFDLGILLSVPTGNWMDEKSNLFSGPPVFGQMNPYFRITIGGGGVKQVKK